MNRAARTTTLVVIGLALLFSDARAARGEAIVERRVRDETIAEPPAPPDTPTQTGRLVNADDNGYHLELTCGASLYTSSIEAKETVLLALPANVGCTLKVVETQKSLLLQGLPLSVRIAGGAPLHPLRFLPWQVQMRTYGVAGTWPEGLVRQWAASATASSEYSEDGWSARQATGAPDTHACGDIVTAWTTKEAKDTQHQWLELRYPQKVRAIGARLFITNAPGALYEVQGRTGSGWETLWRGTDPTASCPAVLEIRFAEEIDTDTLRIVLDLSRQETWFEVDAVELLGQR